MIDERIQRLLGGAKLAELRRRLRKRFERAPVTGLVERFRMDRLNEDEYEALARLQGLSARRANSIQVDVPHIDAALRAAGVASSLREALEKLDGPILHLATTRNSMAARWSEALTRCAHDGLAELLETKGGLALLRRLSKQNPGTAAALIGRASAVLRRLPAAGLARAQLAADVLGDAHALDKGTSVASLVLTVLKQVSESNSVDEEPAVREESARDVWARAGILVNELARPALFLNLPTSIDALQGASLGEPSYLSLRALLRAPPHWSVAYRDVFVCENPNLLAIVADRLGERCEPMVCTDGMPSAAQQVLLSQLMEAGAQLHYHGDFDWPGVRIGNHVMRTWGARPWRFGVSDYLLAVGAAPSERTPSQGLEVEASWDDALTPAMRQHDVLISEESVVDRLLPDLAK
jgi:uncharacterized protein (TIGR02679 family)